VAEYQANIGVINKKSAEVYRYMNFDQIATFSDEAATVQI
jgi:aconitate hydratase 2/2-methylisocitrate dehydratase